MSPLTGWTRDQGDDLDRRNFHLRSLFEAARELSGILQPQKILETFLLLAMGPLGLSRGLAVVLREGGRELASAWRGVPDEAARDLRARLPELAGEALPGHEAPGGPLMPRAVLLSAAGALRERFPEGSEAAVFWSLDAAHSGLLVVGGRIDGASLDAGDLDILLNLTNVLVSSLRHALNTSNIRQLNADMNRRNEELALALDRARRDQAVLDRRVSHLKRLNDLTDELSGLSGTEALLNAFLGNVMGALEVGSGFLLLVDRATRRSRALFRGLEPSRLDFEAADRFLYACFEAAEVRLLAPTSVSRIHDPEPVLGAAGLPPGLSTAVFFVIEQTCLGLVALGGRPDGTALGREEADLLAAQTAGLMAFVKQARALEALRTENEELLRANRDLREALERPGRGRPEAGLPRKMWDRLGPLFHGRPGGAERAGVLDFAAILLLAAALALGCNAGRGGLPLWPESLRRTEPPQVSAAEARGLVEEAGGIVLDTRPAGLYRRKHLPGAVNVPPGLFDVVYVLRLAALAPERPIVVYGRTLSRRYDNEVAFRLSVRDHANVRVLHGGIEAWQAAGYGVQP